MNLIEQNENYYNQLFARGRLIPFFEGSRLVCFITFQIDNEIEKYIDNPWGVYTDNSAEGKICYISQLLTDKNIDNPRLSYEIFHKFKIFIKSKYPLVKKIIWHRWNERKQEADIRIKKI